MTNVIHSFEFEIKICDQIFLITYTAQRLNLGKVKRFNTLVQRVEQKSISSNLIFIIANAFEIEKAIYTEVSRRVESDVDIKESMEQFIGNMQSSSFQKPFTAPGGRRDN